jgi:ribosome-binding factor A
MRKSSSHSRQRGPKGTRPLRIAELLQRELSMLIARELSDPRVGRLTITSVDVAPDMSHAKVYFTHLSGVGDAPQTVSGLNHAAGFLRNALKGRVQLRVIPELRFVYDESVEKGVALSHLIDQAVGKDRTDNE